MMQPSDKHADKIPAENQPATEQPTKEIPGQESLDEAPVKRAETDATKNTADTTPGLNEGKIKSEERQPLD